MRNTVLYCDITVNLPMKLSGPVFLIELEISKLLVVHGN